MRRVNLGNYEHEEVAVTVTIGDMECHVHAAENLKSDVEVALGLKKAAKKEEVKVPELPPVIKEEEAPVKKVAKKKTTKKKVVKKEAVKKAPKLIPYNRATDHHKTAFIAQLTELFPEWKTTTETKAAAKEASMSMVGLDMMDSTGAIVETFKAKLTELMSVSPEEDI